MILYIIFSLIGEMYRNNFCFVTSEFCVAAVLCFFLLFVNPYKCFSFYFNAQQSADFELFFFIDERKARTEINIQYILKLC